MICLDHVVTFKQRIVMHRDPQIRAPLHRTHCHYSRNNPSDLTRKINYTIALHVLDKRKIY